MTEVKTLDSDFWLPFPPQGFSSKIFFFFFDVGFESIYASFVGKFTYVHTVVFIFVSGPEWDQEKAANSLKLSQSSRISFFSSSL